MNAILFGSIGSIAETSELQRRAFNQAFKAHGLNWVWEREQYQALLLYSGGQQRIAAYAHGHIVDAQAIHETKSKIFQTLLAESGIAPRSGVLATIRRAQQEGVLVALVSATSPKNVAELIAALHPHIHAEDFAVIIDGSCFEHPKPLPDAYVCALKRLGLAARQCVAIEDNKDGVQAAHAAGLGCIAFPGENTANHDFSAALKVVDSLNFEQISAFIPTYNGR